jgi:YidC/Oxa1 family membrane protein insertase
VNGSQNKKPLSAEFRILIASLLSMGVILLWVRFFAPKPPLSRPLPNTPAQTAPASPNASNPANPSVSMPSSGGRKSSSTTVAAAPLPIVIPKSATTERTLVVENDLYRVEISNRGAVVKSWQLKKYKDDCSYGQRTLDLVQNGQKDCSKTKDKDVPRETAGWPFALALDDAQLEASANTGLYKVSADGSELHAPAEAEFSWSDGHLEVTKHFKFDHSYVVQTQINVKLDGRPITAGLAWLGGFGDLTVTNPIPVESVTTFYSENGKLSTTAAKKLDDLSKVGRGVWQGGKDFAGIQDRFFAAAFLPPSGTLRGALETRYWKLDRTIHVASQPDTQEPVAEVAATSAEHPLALRVYVGPKDYDDLKKMNPPLHGLVNFGWLEFIADPLFHGMKWLHEYIPNWGWTIVVLTLVINMLLFPLRISSYKTTLKMQRVAPEIKAIQERYKKYKLNDPKKAEMNKEVMAIYSREGINPVGGCFQMFLQMPIWFGLNTALRSAIEMRHATWLWITDLSAKDPYYALPILMGLSMYLVSKMTPMTATDPQQQMMMKIMPISMAAIFMISPISSGLAVYILTSSLVGIAQQWYLNRKHPVTVPAKQPRGAKSKELSGATK